MSSVIKGAKKVFKKVIKVVKKVAPIAVGVGALLFTGGAALGLAPALGNWGAAASAISAKMGATGVLGSALTGAITQAGYGSLISGAVSGLTGGSVSEGMARGALVGGATGGLLGAYSHLRGPAQPDLTAAPGSQGSTIDGATGEVIAGGARTYPLPADPQPPAMTPIDAAGNPVAPAAGGATNEAIVGKRGLLSRVGAFAKDNPELTGGILKGIGAGLVSDAAADDELNLMVTRQRLRGDNYRGADPGAGYRGASASGSGQTPSQRFDPKNYGSWEYQYDPAAGRIVRVPVGG